MRNFPERACEEASAFLANILKYKYNYDNVKIVRAHAKDGNGYHAWVKVDNIDLDITADQIEECDKKVIIEIKSIFHKNNFNIINSEGLIDTVNWPGNRQKYYNEILKYMKLK